MLSSGRWRAAAVWGAALVWSCSATDRTFIPDDEFYGTGGAAGAGAVSGSGGQAGGAGTGGASGSSGTGGADSGADATSDAATCDGVVCDSPPPNACEDATTLRVFSTAGTCEGGVCSYGHQSVKCQGGCAKNGTCIDDPCVGVTCNKPPANKCANAGALTVYDASGVCNAGTCSYPSKTQTCSFGCASDACTGDPCAGVSCTSPPASYCVDAFVKKSFGNGTCNTGTCTYSPTDTTCQYGCAAGACKGDPCAGVSCTSPPAKYCVNATTLRSFANPGTCAGGSCTYAPSDSTCQFGCVNGACSTTDPCQGVTCTSPPGPSCFNATTLRTSTSPGTCAGGNCSYPYNDQACQYGCANNACKACSAASHCSAGQWCSAGACTACSAAACGDGECDCGETTATCASDCGPPCPTGLVIGSWTNDDQGWTKDGLWKRNSSGQMVAGSTTSYNSPYTQNLTYGTNVNLLSCTTATLKFSVKLSDDSTWSPDVDKSERLWVQCSGDGGGSWNNLTPTAWPANQSPCATSYCDGGEGLNRSFPWTSQTLTLPAACRTATARFRFQAKGTSVWRLQNPGWWVDDVTVN